jgi:lipopolysaccharide biosynthesis regulator YciM
MPPLPRPLRTALDTVRRWVRPTDGDSGSRDPRVTALIEAARAARQAGRSAEAKSLYQQALDLNRSNVIALSALRDLAAESGRWADALPPQQRLVALVAPADRSRETGWLAAIHYELGRAELAAGNAPRALVCFRNSLRVDRRFLPASVALGAAHQMAGDHREAVRVWERAAELEPALPILSRLEQAYRGDDRPTRMISLYERAQAQAPDDLALAVALGRVYFELEMLDEAAEQFQRVEVRAPHLPAVHAYLGAIFERRGQTREAFAEYRQGLRLAHAFEPAYRCSVCGATEPAWRDRCPACGRWNTCRP